MKTPWHRSSMGDALSGLWALGWSNCKWQLSEAYFYFAWEGTGCVTFALGLLQFFFHRNCSLQQFFLEHTLDLTQPGPGRLEIFRNNLSNVCDLKRLQYLKRRGPLNLLDGSLNPRMVFLYRMQLNGLPRVSDGSTLSFLPRSIAFKSFTHSHAKV